MIQAAPLVLSFARAVPMLNRLVGAIGITELGNRVNNYIQENPEESEKIVSMIMPAQGIANALKNKSSEDVEEVQESEIFINKEKISLEDLDEMTDEEAADLPDEDKAELMKQAGKKRDRELSIATSEKLGLSGPGKEKIDIEREIDERVDPGGIQKEKKGYDFRDYIPKGAYKKRYADGGAIGIEVLFEEKNPRQGLFMGGSPLTGQALQTYNSMKAYGFSDQEIADALSLQRASASNAETATAATAAPINIYNQLGGGGNGPDDDDDGPTSNAGLKGFDAVRTAGLFALNPVGYLASKALTGLYNNYKNPYTNVLGVTNAATKAAITREETRDLQDRIDRGDFGSNTPTPQDKGRTDKGGKGSGSSDGSKGSRGGGMGGFGGGADRD